MAILLIFSTLLVAAFLSFFVKKQIKILSFLAVSASLVELSSVLIIAASVVKNGPYSVTDYFSVNSLGAILMLILATVGLMASWYSTGYLKAEVAKGIIGLTRVRQYFVLLHLFLFAMFFAVITSSPILMWIAIEATTLSTAFLISFYNKPSAMEAAWKYLIINSVGLLFAFFGTLLFLYPSVISGFHGLATWQTLMSNAAALNPVLAKIAFIFIFIGYGTKVGLVPMHTWLPDAHSKAPAPISSLLSGVLLNVAFFAILRFKTITDAVVGIKFSQEMLMTFGAISVVVAAFIIFIQKSYKRLLAYSSIENMGIIAVGFGFGGAGAFAALLHMIYHAFAKTILFLSSGNIFLKYSTTKIKNIRGILSVLPATGVLFLIGFLTITGVPPFGIFLTEFSILSSGIGAHPIVTVIILLALALAFVGFLRHVVAMMFGKTDKDISVGEGGVWTVAPILILTAVVIVLSLFVPSAIKSLIISATSAY